MEAARASTSPAGQTEAYSFTVFHPGEYQLEVRAPGFQDDVEPGLILTSDTPLNFDVRLVLKPKEDSVTVEVAVVQLDTSTTQLGQTISTREVMGTPLNGRSFTDLLALQSGVVPVSSQQPNAVVMSGCTSTPPSGDLESWQPFCERAARNQQRFRGQRQRRGRRLQHGHGNCAQPRRHPGYSAYSPAALTREYGNFSGGQVLVVTKSGANQFHGSGFEFLRNTALDSRSYFSASRAQYDRNQYGGTVGGPVVRDKVFFFADYQGTQMAQGIETGLISVPSLADRSGNLADVANSLTGNVNGQYWAGVLSQKLGYAVSPGEPYYTSGCTSAAQCVFPERAHSAERVVRARRKT